MPLESFANTFFYPVGQPGAAARIRLEVRFRPEDLKKLKNSAGQFIKLDNFEVFWNNYRIGGVIRDDIKKNIKEKKFPDNIGAGPWNELSEEYSKRVGGRSQMFLRSLDSNTGIWDAYVGDPIIEAKRHFLRYSPKQALIIKKGADIGLRFGVDRINLPAREWFGLNKTTQRNIYTLLDKHMKGSLEYLAKHGTLKDGPIGGGY